MPMELPGIRDINPGYLPAPQKKFEDSAEIQEKLDPEVKQTLEYIHRGELGVPSHALRAAAWQYSNHCDIINKEYMLCRKEECDPRKCLKYNNKVSECAEKFFKEVTDACGEQLVEFGKCLETKYARSYENCRTQQLAFDKCVLDKLGYDKPMHTMVNDTTVKTDRPKPKNPLNFPPSHDTRRFPARDFFQRPPGNNRDY